MHSVIDRMSVDLGVPKDLIEDALDLAYIRFRKLKVPKKSGGYREIVQPAAELKLIHAWLSSRVLSLVPLSPVASAFRPSASIVKNAAAHKNSKYLVRIDLQDFFPSIRSGDLNQAILGNQSSLPEWAVGDDCLNLLRNACFDRFDRLPIGYPTSPSIANIVMVGIDKELMQTIASDSGLFGRGVLTRYADDFVFSSDAVGACRNFVDMAKALVEDTKSPKLTINDTKTRYMSRPGGSALVTGLRINQAGEVRVHPEYRDHVRLLLKLFARGSLQPDDHRRLVGHLAYVEHADPKLFTRLSFRYFEEITKLRMG